MGISDTHCVDVINQYLRYYHLNVDLFCMIGKVDVFSGGGPHLHFLSMLKKYGHYMMNEKVFWTKNEILFMNATLKKQIIDWYSNNDNETNDIPMLNTHNRLSSSKNQHWNVQSVRPVHL